MFTISMIAFAIVIQKPKFGYTCTCIYLFECNHSAPSSQIEVQGYEIPFWHYNHAGIENWILCEAQCLFSCCLFLNLNKFVQITCICFGDFEKRDLKYIPDLVNRLGCRDLGCNCVM